MHWEDDPYFNHVQDELEMRAALETVICDRRVIDEAIKHYQSGRNRDRMLVEAALAGGAAFQTVDKIIANEVHRRYEAHKTFSNKLRTALKKSHPKDGQRYQAHHIVAHSARLARAAAKVLKALGIDIHGKNNGVWLPEDDQSKQRGTYKNAYIHNTVHTDVYYANISYEVVSAFENDATDEEMKRLRRRIAEQLQNGTYPIIQVIPGAERHLISGGRSR